MAARMGRRTSIAVADHDHLAALGIKQELKRNFSFISLFGFAFASLNSWTALSTSLSLALPSGGSTAVVWGLVAAGICSLAIAISLAEFLSALPSAGGQYHWAAFVSPKRYMPILSWITGWICVFGWMALAATGGLLGSTLIIGIISLYDANYMPHRWHQFLIYIGYNVVAACVNAFGVRLLPLINKTAMFWSLAGFSITIIVVLATSSPDYNSGHTVFQLFLNETGWPDGVAWLLGLLQGGFGLTGFDAVSHMIEEIPNPTVEGPKIMIYVVAVGLVTGWIFLVVLLFVAGNIGDVISSASGPLGQIYLNATNSKAGTVCLLMFPLVCLLFATNCLMATSSRMTYAFARDRGLPFSKFFARVHPRLDSPLESLALVNLVIVIFGCIFLGSSTAYNAIVSASVVAVSVSYAMPISINCLRGRKALPEDRPFKLPEWFAWPVNLLSIAYIILTSVLFLFPPDLPVTGSNMNYAIVAFGVVLLISALTWIFDGRKNFVGPKVETDHEVLTATPTSQHSSAPDEVQGNNFLADQKANHTTATRQPENCASSSPTAYRDEMLLSST